MPVTIPEQNRLQTSLRPIHESLGLLTQGCNHTTDSLRTAAAFLYYMYYAHTTEQPFLCMYYLRG